MRGTPTGARASSLSAESVGRAAMDKGAFSRSVLLFFREAIAAGVRDELGTAKCQPLRRLLVFWTASAENDDKAIKVVYHCGLQTAERFKSGGPSLGRSPGAQKQRRPVNQDKI
jgi:hypothetical protein